MAKTGNPFMDLDFTGMTDFSKYAEQFKVPGLDTNAMMEAQRKNLEAIASANKATIEGAQAIARRQAEILQEAAGEMRGAMEKMVEPGAPEQKMASQAALAKDIFETAIGNMRELAEMGAKSNSEAMETINKRVSESLEEIKAMIEKSGK